MHSFGRRGVEDEDFQSTGAQGFRDNVVVDQAIVHNQRVQRGKAQDRNEQSRGDAGVVTRMRMSAADDVHMRHTLKFAQVFLKKVHKVEIG